MHQPLALKTLIENRLEQIGRKGGPANVHQFAQKLKQNAGNVRLWVDEHDPLPVKHIERWSEVLEWPKGSPEYDDFCKTVYVSRLLLKKSSSTAEAVDFILRRLETAERELRELRALSNAATPDGEK